MPGQLLRVVPKQTVSLPPSGASSVGPIAKMINATGFREATLLVRVHTLSAWANLGAATGNANTITIDVFGEAPTEEDPSLDFLSKSLFSSPPSISQANVSSTAVAPGSQQGCLFFTAIGSSTLPAFLRVVVTQVGGSSALTITYSVDLVLKS